MIAVYASCRMLWFCLGHSRYFVVFVLFVVIMVFSLFVICVTLV